MRKLVIEIPEELKDLGEAFANARTCALSMTVEESRKRSDGMDAGCSQSMG